MAVQYVFVYESNHVDYNNLFISVVFRDYLACLCYYCFSLLNVYNKHNNSCLVYLNNNSKNQYGNQIMSK